MHSKRILHRDIKPSNIVISEDEQEVTLVDFGISCNISEPRNNKIFSKLSGTLGYIDPFLVKQSYIDGNGIKGSLSDEDFLKSDIFSLGATLYQFITGKELIQGQNFDECIALTINFNFKNFREKIDDDQPEHFRFYQISNEFKNLIT